MLANNSLVQHCILLSDDVTIMTSSLRKVVYVFRIKFPTKRIFRIFPILRTDGMAPFGTYLWNDPRISCLELKVPVPPVPLKLWHYCVLQMFYYYYVVLLLPRDASVERGDATVSRLSVCP